MRGANPRRLGTVCQLCAIAPVPTSTQVIIRRAISTQARYARGLSAKPIGVRWLATKNPSVPRELLNPTQLANAVENARDKFLSVDGIPAKQLTSAALETCLKAAEALQPLVRRAEAQVKASTSKLRSLGAGRGGSSPSIDVELRDSVNRISYSAYAIITQPNVEITPEFLELYVIIQAALGRSDSLPTVLELFATKPQPVVKNGVIQYVRRNPNAAVRAIEPDVADMALQTAIDSKNLDSALGIVEASFSLPAFKRQKLLKHSTAPALALTTLPFGIFGLASAYAAYWQNTMDITTATGLGVAGISGYFLVVGSMGLIAKLSNKDQMRRVTWAPGTPLRYRWLREEERAAMDKIACAWGFKEPWRHGEETGPEWEGLKEYMGYRQMILDRVEFMDGMS
ncbi:hypothetical protein BGZ63DRAFT_411675 [Mariannaea sp. PMI_226]|nr:hypothetical protein BGZ63DRAFT_411675 [Mariannaea sp. PMI_226]